MILENCGTRHGHKSGFAFGGAHGQIGFITANYLNDFSALQRAADVETDDGAVEVNVTVIAWAFDARGVLRGGERRKEKSKKGKKGESETERELHRAPAGFHGMNVHNFYCSEKTRE